MVRLQGVEKGVPMLASDAGGVRYEVGGRVTCVAPKKAAAPGLIGCCGPKVRTNAFLLRM